MSSTSTTWSTQGNTKAGATSTSTDSLTTGTLTANTIQLADNVIKASDGGNTITLDTSDNVTILGDLTVTGNNLTFGNGEVIGNVSDTTLSFSNATSYSFIAPAGTNASKLQIKGSGSDAGIILYNTTGIGSPEWSICFDDDDSDTLKFDAGTATVGGATKLSLTEGGDLKVHGKFACNGQTPDTAPDYSSSSFDENRTITGSTSTANTKDVLATLISDLIAIGILQ